MSAGGRKSLATSSSRISVTLAGHGGVPQLHSSPSHGGGVSSGRSASRSSNNHRSTAAATGLELLPMYIGVSGWTSAASG